MSVAEYAMRLGRWQLDLAETTPGSLLAKLDDFGHLHVTPTRLERGATAATALAAARYTGVLRGTSNSFRHLEGVSVAHWLGDEDGKGAVIKAGTGSSGATKPLSGATGWVEYVVQTNYLNVGSVDTDTTNRTLRIEYIDRRTALDIVCDAYGVEWQVDAQGDVNVGDADYLYGATPTALFVAHGGTDRDAIYEAARTLEVNVERDVEDFTTEVVVLDTSGTYGTAGGASSTVYSLLGNVITITRIMDASTSVAAADASAFATTQLGRFDSARTRFEVVADEYDITGRIQVGARAYIYDPTNRLTDLDNAVDHGGVTIHPVEVRVVGMEWPVQQGMGVYFRRSDSATPELVDLTDHVVWDRSATVVEVGASNRRLTGEVFAL